MLRDVRLVDLNDEKVCSVLQSSHHRIVVWLTRLVPQRGVDPFDTLSMSGHTICSRLLSLMVDTFYNDPANLSHCMPIGHTAKLLQAGAVPALLSLLDASCSDPWGVDKDHDEALHHTTRMMQSMLHHHAESICATYKSRPQWRTIVAHLVQLLRIRSIGI